MQFLLDILGYHLQIDVHESASVFKKEYMRICVSILLDLLSETTLSTIHLTTLNLHTL